MSAPTPAQLLDQLMGQGRNSMPGKKPLRRHWSDKDVCKHYLAAFCPNELFLNTKGDMGECTSKHADVLKEQYEQSSEYGTRGYEEDLRDFLERIISDCDRKIERVRQRLQNNKDRNKDARDKANAERQAFLDVKIEHLLAKLEALGNQGKVNEAQEVADVIEKLRAEKNAPIDSYALQRSDLTSEKEMDVCEVCGALILVGDTQLRIEDHIMGKQHNGYAKVREQYALMKESYWIKNSSAKKTTEEDDVKKDSRSPSRKRRKFEDRSSDSSKPKRRRKRSSSSDGRRRRRDKSPSRHKRRRSSSDSSRNDRHRRRSSRKEKSKKRDSDNHSRHRDERKSDRKE